MAKYRKKPIEVEATQWFKNGDHPRDDTRVIDVEGPSIMRTEGKVVRRHYMPEDTRGDRSCGHCVAPMRKHGWIDTLEGGHVVCPGDWIITGVAGEMYPCKPDIFEQTYELAD